MVQTLDLNLLLVQLPFELLRTSAQGESQLQGPDYAVMA